MTLLIIGLAVFFAAHLTPAFPGLRDGLRARFGAGGYKGAFAILSLAGLALIVLGYRDAPFQAVYQPLAAAKGLAHALMPIAFILAAGANMKSNLKRYVRHPLATAVLIWGLVHLSANGDLASVVMFGAFALYALLDMTVIGKAAATPPVQPRKKDLILVAAGVVGFVAAMLIHGVVGPSVMG